MNSRYKTADSESDSNFKFELPYVLNTPSNCIFYITDVCIPNLFKTISTGENDTLYVEYTAHWDGIFDSSTYTIYNSVTLPPGNYTELSFASALDQQLNTATNGALRVDYNSPNNVCSIYTNGDTTAFRILTDEEIQTKLNTSGNTLMKF